MYIRKEILEKEQDILDMHFNQLMPISEIKKLYEKASYDDIKNIILKNGKQHIFESEIKFIRLKLLLPKDKLEDLHYNQLLSINTIRKTYKVQEKYIHRLFQEYGLIPLRDLTPRKVAGITQKKILTVEKVLEANKEIKTVKSLAKNFGVSITILREFCKKNKINLILVCNNANHILKNTEPSEIKKLLSENPVNEAAKILKISSDALRKYMKEQGLSSLYSPPRILNETHKEEIQNLFYCQMKTTTEIARHFGVCHYTIYRFMIDNNLSLITTSEKQYNSVKSDLHHDYLENKLSLVALGQKYSLNPDFISRQLKNDGVYEGHRASVSQHHYEIMEFLNSLGINFEVNNRTIISPFEIDIVIPDLKIGIEYHGLYYHSTAIATDYNYHYKKYKLAKEAGYRLVQIFADEWIYKQDIVKDKLLSIVNKNQQSVYARNCKIQEISFSEHSEFTKKHHLQGAGRGSINVGLFNRGNLVAVLNVLKHQGYLEIDRYASSVRVVGGFSKLLSYIIKQFTPIKIITYADLRWTDPTNNLYLSTGFTLIKETKVGYSYTKDFKLRMSRQKFMKHKLSKVLEIYNESLSEFENMKANGYHRVYDCGHLKYELVVSWP